jgi:ABC-type uncharacterized transport system fused permease/ATPase subunit
VRAGLTNADQRITEDVEKFAFTVADLFSYTFKPLLDVILFTRSLGKIIGYKPQVHDVQTTRQTATWQCQRRLQCCACACLHNM